MQKQIPLKYYMRLRVVSIQVKNVHTFDNYFVRLT